MASSNIAFSENIYDKKHKIDIWKENASIKAGTTQNILELNNEAYRKWDKALNDVYKSLMNKLPENDKKLLRESQRKWLSFQKSEFKFMSLHIHRAGGSLSRVISSERRLAFIRNRVVELEAYEFIFDSPP